MRRRLRCLILGLATLATPAWAELVVVANPKSGIDRLSRQDVVHLFMGRLRQLPSGIPAVPHDLPVESSDHAAFYRQLVNKDVSEIRAYWTRLVFSGGVRPPRAADGPAELVRLIAADPGAIGYLDRSRVDARLRIVYEFPANP